MSKMLSISVALCTYNGEKYLREQLRSIAAQTRLPDELVICDDGSTDPTAAIIDEFSRSVPFPVRFIRNPENLGSTKNFEKAIGLCIGDLIALSDQDDIWLPEKLARQSEMMERDSSLGGVFSDAELIDATSARLNKCLWGSIQFRHGEQKRLQEGRAIDILLRRNVVTGATLMVRASLRPQFLPIPEIWVHDGWIAWMLVLHSKLRLIEQSLIEYRIHPSQQAGVEVLTQPPPPTLRGRLEKGKREEPAKHAAYARQLEGLERWMIDRSDLRSSTLIPNLRRAIRFSEDRGRPFTGRLGRLNWIVRNAASYHRYEGGSAWKCLVRDLVIACLR
jgi:glycosyltransferase involved in cell wall biosynthesis